MRPPAPGEPRRPHGPRDSGDAWVVADDGTRYWGRYGAAGLLALDPARGVLLQHRVAWSHHGDTWALPGGARHEGESACDGALRESAEEAGVPPGAVAPRLISVFDVGIWTYSTVVADVTDPFEAVISDPESRELSWVPVADVDRYPLHPGFEPRGGRCVRCCRCALPSSSTLRTSWAPCPTAGGKTAPARRRGCSTASLNALGAGRTPAPSGFRRAPGSRRSRSCSKGRRAPLTTFRESRWVRATGSGDDAIVAEAGRLRAAGRQVTVVTSDRGLRDRLPDAAVRPVSWLRDLA